MMQDSAIGNNARIRAIETHKEDTDARDATGTNEQLAVTGEYVLVLFINHTFVHNVGDPDWWNIFSLMAFGHV